MPVAILTYLAHLRMRQKIKGMANLEIIPRNLINCGHTSLPSYSCHTVYLALTLVLQLEKITCGNAATILTDLIAHSTLTNWTQDGKKVSNERDV